MHGIGGKVDKIANIFLTFINSQLNNNVQLVSDSSTVIMTSQLFVLQLTFVPTMQLFRVCFNKMYTSFTEKKLDECMIRGGIINRQ